ncbi:phosphatase PAP2 family protein [Spirillospora sp. NPDC047279]|uniref:phosphatase PAP2 family protein n=1 Tax=Spirillospora sp. NPDC047279 TaxID=3155478 RepID=UPI00340C32BA
MTSSANPEGGTRRRRRPARVWFGRVLALTIVVLIFGKALPHFVDLREVATILRGRVSPAELTLLGLLTAASVLVSALGLRAALPGLALAPACVINVVTTAVSYALPGGGAAGAALNFTMSRELGFGTRAVSLQTVVTGVWNIASRLTLPLMALGMLGVVSEVPPGVRGAGVAGLLLAVLLLALFAASIRFSRPLEVAITIGDRLSGPILRRFGREPKVHDTTVAAFQADARGLIHAHWPALTVSAFGYHLILFGVLYGSLQAAGVTRVGVLEAFAVYAVARQVTAIPLTPGSAGVIELALIAGLDLTGADLPAATAGVVLFRFFTFLLYLPAGAGLWAWWRWIRPTPRVARHASTPVVRHTGDLVRTAAGVAALVTLVAMSQGVVRADADFFRLVNDLPDTIEVPVWIVMQAGWIGMAALAGLIALSLRRVHLAVDLVLAGWLAWFAAKVVKDLAGRPRPAALLDHVHLRADAITGGTGLPAGHTAVAAALVTVLGSALPRPYRRVLWTLVAAVGLARVYVGAHLPTDVLAGAVLGWALASAVLFAHGAAPRLPRPEAVRALLLRRGHTVEAVEPMAGDLRRAVPFAATTSDGRLFVKVIGRDQHDTDLLHRLGRLWRRRPGDPPFVTAKQQVEHEGYLLLRAARAGARVPRVRFLASAPGQDWAMASDLIGGRVLSAVEAMDDAQVDDLWRQLAMLRSSRIAHRDLRADNIILDAGGEPWIVGWGAAEADTVTSLLDEDAAALVELTTIKVGEERATAAAARAAASSPAQPIGSMTVREHEVDPAPLPVSFSARHPGDVVRLVAGSALGLTLAVFAAGGFLLTVEADAFRLVNGLPGWLFWPVNVIMQAGALGAVAVTAVVALLCRRVRLAVDLALGGTLAYVLAKLVKSLADRGRPGELLSEVVLRGASEGGLGFVSGHAAVAAALATVAAAHVRRPLRWAFWAIAVGVGVARLYVGAHFPLDVIAGAALGWAVGGAVHLLRGTPTHLPDSRRIAAALTRCGIDAPRVRLLKSDARGSVPFTAIGAGGERVFVKALGRDQRDADLLFKAARFLLYRETEDETPFPSPKRQVEHEAYHLLRAASAGVRVPELVGVAPAGHGSWILAEEAVSGPGDLSGSQARLRLDDGCLRALWEEVSRLHAAGIAHRDLRLANVLVDTAGRPVLVDFGFAEDAASPRRLAQDVAQLLTSTALAVGPHRAARTASDVIGPASVGAAAPYLQPLALSAATRTALREHPELLAALREEIAHIAGTPDDPPPLSRIPTRPWMLALLVLVGYVTYHALIGIPPVRGPFEVFGGVGLRWLAVAALLVIVSYVAGALALLGATTARLALGRTSLHQVAATFASRQHRPGRGSSLVLITYLRAHGVGSQEAAGAVALTRLTGTVVHLVALALALVAAGLQGPVATQAPAWTPLVLVWASTLAALGAGSAWHRRAEILAPMRAALRTLPELRHRPGRAAMLVVGNAGVTSCSVLAFLSVAYTFGTPSSPAVLATTYLLITPLRLLGPLAGGVGVVEPVLVLALVMLGTGPAEAVVTVIAFRLLSYWLPILPGALALYHFRRGRRGRSRRRDEDDGGGAAADEDSVLSPGRPTRS